MNQALMEIVNQSDDLGPQLVDHTFHTTHGHLPDDSRESAHFFEARMLNVPHHATLGRLDHPANGSTPKIHFRVGGRKDDEGKPLPSSIFMVKPYYEKMHGWRYGPLPIAGWAEMAYHGILHKSQLGHLAMRLHAFPYGGKALLGVELDPGVVPVAYTLPHGDFPNQPAWDPKTSAGRVSFPANVKDDASKMAALDFLLNHQDRNSQNIMMQVGDDGVARRLLAIDNGRSMQYLESNRYNIYKNRDNLFNYLGAPGYKAIFGKDNRWKEPLSTITTWWKANKPAIVSEFTRHARFIKDPSLAHHIVSSFEDRVDALDAVSRDFEIHGAKPYDDYRRGESSNYNKPIYNRAGVAMRKTEALGDFLSACPTCGEEY